MTAGDGDVFSRLAARAVGASTSAGARVARRVETAAPEPVGDGRAGLVPVAEPAPRRTAPEPPPAAPASAPGRDRRHRDEEADRRGEVRRRGRDGVAGGGETPAEPAAAAEATGLPQTRTEATPPLEAGAIAPRPALPSRATPPVAAAARPVPVRARHAVAAEPAPRAPVAEPAPARAEAPQVTVHIGRVEVRATLIAPAPTPRPQDTAAENDGLRLSDYLRNRQGAR